MKWPLSTSVTLNDPAPLRPYFRRNTIKLLIILIYVYEMKTANVDFGNRPDGKLQSHSMLVIWSPQLWSVGRQNVYYLQVCYSTINLDCSNCYKHLLNYHYLYMYLNNFTMYCVI